MGVCHPFGSSLLKEIFKNSSFLLQGMLRHAKGQHCAPAPPSPPVTYHQWGQKALRGKSERMILMIISHLKNWAGPRLFCVQRHKVTKFGKVRTTGHTSNIIPLLGIRIKRQFLWLSAFSNLENIKLLGYSSILVLIYLHHLWRKPQTRKKLP